MKFKEYMNEKYHKSFKIAKNTFEVFKNPSSSEIKIIKTDAAKGFIDSKGDLFIFINLHGDHLVLYHDQLLKVMNWNQTENETNCFLPLIVSLKYKEVIISADSLLPESCDTKYKRDVIKKRVKSSKELITIIGSSFKLESAELRK